MKTTIYTLPAYWASALINGDFSGLEDSEEKEINDFIAGENLGSCLDCTTDPEFKRTNDAGTLAGDCLDFTFQVS